MTEPDASSQSPDQTQCQIEEPLIPHSSTEAAVSQNPSDARTHHALGLALIETRQWAESLDHLVEAVRLAPDHARYRSDLVHMIRGHLEHRSEPRRLRAWESLTGEMRLMYWRELEQQARSRAILGIPRRLFLMSLGLLLLMLLLWIAGQPVRAVLWIGLLISAAGLALRWGWRGWTHYHTRHIDRQ